MSVPNRQIGWSNESNLLWNISKQLEKLNCQICTQNVAIYRYYGSFYSVVDQSSTANVSKAMEYEVTDISNGVTIENNLLGRPTRITFQNSGVYDIQFSAQLNNTDGGGSSVHADIWLVKGGNPVANSATKVSVTPNSPYMVAAWNFFVQASAGDYYELFWKPSITALIIQHEDAAGDVPAIPSVILTVNNM